MNVEVQSLDQVRKKVEVILPEEAVKELESEIFAELKKQAKIKGFRPGKAPKSIITSLYKDYIEDELKKRMVQTTMGEALFTAKVTPLVEPIVEFVEKERNRGYTLECEVEPEIELPSYKGLEVEVEKITVTDEDIAHRIDGLRNMHAEMIMKEGDQGAVKGDFVIVKYQAYDDGKPVKEVATEAYPLELGTTTLLPEFEAGLYGMKSGEERDIDVNFPDDYPDKDIASRKLVFKVTLKEIREKRLPEVNEEFAKDLSFESLEVMKEGLKKEIEAERESNRKKSITEQLIKHIVTGTDVPVPQGLLEKRIEAMMGEAKSRFKGQRMAEEEEIAIENVMREQFKPRAEVGIKAEMVLARIAAAEGIKAEDNEVDEKIKAMAEEVKRPYQEVHDFYEQYNMLGGLKQGIAEEKTIDFLREHAIFKEKE
ncbi:MAG: trigger factor [Syntrophus sp. (in: bacteria)]|nr:trigger factor [Syntrophus sp. (in: bacteria)]